MAIFIVIVLIGSIILISSLLSTISIYFPIGIILSAIIATVWRIVVITPDKSIVGDMRICIYCKFFRMSLNERLEKFLGVDKEAGRCLHKSNFEVNSVNGLFQAKESAKAHRRHPCDNGRYFEPKDPPKKKLTDVDFEK